MTSPLRSAGLLIYLLFFFCTALPAQEKVNLLLNGGFEDINTCSEYQAECGVEGWFYLRDVKAQMLSNAGDSIARTGNNSYGIYFDWNGYTGFSPIMGTLLPCGLQAGHSYIFSGILSATLNPKLTLAVGMAAAERYYVPNRPFAKNISLQPVSSLEPVPNSPFFRFTTTFTATGTERYLTFGVYIAEDSLAGKRMVSRKETISLVFDQFALTPVQPDEAPCAAFFINKKIIYGFDARHKTMDYGLYARGEIPVKLQQADSSFLTTRAAPKPLQPAADTLLLSDVFFDFNKSALREEAVLLLKKYFTAAQVATIDSLVIEGHTDSIGTDEKNIVLSSNRSASVQQWLQSNTALQPFQMRLHAQGEARPVATNSTPEGRALNRRVEIILFRKKHP